MSVDSILSEDIRRAVGNETTPMTIEVDKTLIRRFADAVDDPNPLWLDEVKAHKSRNGGIIAPPSLLCASLAAPKQAWEIIADILPKRMLDGGGEWEFYEPIRLGDTLTVVSKLAAIVERPTRLGPMLVLTSAITWRNQRQEVVAKATCNLMRY